MCPAHTLLSGTQPFSLPVFCTSSSQQQVYKPVPCKVVCSYFSGFRVLKLYFKPSINVFTVLLFHKPLITGNDALFNGIKCLQTVLSTAAYASGFSTQKVLPVAADGCSEPAAGLLTASSPHGAGRTEQDLGGCSLLLLLSPFQPVDMVFLCLP